mgnify:CR=1 FL=1
MHGERLGRWLLDHGRLTAAQLEEARRTRSFFGGDLGTHLVNLGYLDEFGLAEALAEITGVPCADDRLRRVLPEVAARLSPELASRHRACPFEIEGDTIRVAMRNPRDGVAIAAIRGAVGLEPEVWVASERRLQVALSRCYGIEPEGVRGLSLGRPSRSPASRTDAARRDDPVATGADADEVGLDGLPLDAEVTFDDPVFFQHHRGAPVEDRPAEADAPVASGVDPSDASPAPPGDARRSTPPEPVEATGPLERLEERLSLAIDRDDIAIALLEFCRLRASRCALFAITRDGLRCLAGHGRSLDTERLQRIQIPRESGTVFDAVLGAEEFYLGPVPPLPANKDLFSLLGGRLPPSILVVPIRLKGRAVALLYLDDDGNSITAPDLPLMRRVAAKAGLAFEILLLRGKLRDA